MSILPSKRKEWKELERHFQEIRLVSLRELFERDKERASKFSVKLDGLTADFSRNHLAENSLDILVNLAKAVELEVWRSRMFSGDKINNTENRAVLHTALRAKKQDPILVDRKNIIPDIKSLHKKMSSFCKMVQNGEWLGATGKPLDTVINLGIGGSDLGPRMVVGALERYRKLKTRFVANADAADLLGAFSKINPETSFFIIVSKTFTTQETLLNARSAKQWLMAKLGAEAVSRHFIAVTTNIKAAEEFGIASENIFPMWDWVGGRFSLWSSVGLSIALAIGWENFESLLEGAAVMDEHFLTASLSQNMPVLLGLVGIWYRNFWKTSCHAVLPYSERLRDLPRYLQQLEMESNGKSVTRDGIPVDYATAPAIIGECGTIGQHSFHQWLHQGTDITPVDFIGIREDDLQKPEHHKVLLANMLAQAEALRLGKNSPDPHKSNPGNRPSTILWLDRLDPRCLGLLLALYEHKVFVQGIIWGINSFDQWGVELGKELAKNISV